MHAVYLITGLLVLLAAAVDIVWTTIGTHGGGPLSQHLTHGLWRLAVAIHRRHPNHRALSFVGSIVMLSLIAFWIAITCLGWYLIFSSDQNALLNPLTGEHPHFAGRVYFVAYAMSTLGNGDYQPRPGGWQIVTAIETLLGMCSLTLAVSFILSVVTAVIEKRSLAALIDSLGGSPEEILSRAWTGDRFEGLEPFLIDLATMIAVSVEQHLAYPLLHQFHGEIPRTSTELRLNSLHETMLLLEHGVAPEIRISRPHVRAVRNALDAMAIVFRDEFIGTTETVPPCSLDVLRNLSIPTASPEEFETGVKNAYETRQALYAALLDDGWTWQDISAGPVIAMRRRT